MTPTPMTDAHYEQRIAEGCVGVDPDFARQLERELAEANRHLAIQIEAFNHQQSQLTTQRAALEKASQNSK